MRLESGQRIAHYRILAPLGRGGMGEVWRAADTRLGREVALKIPPEEFTRDPDRLMRFEREARLLASLEHQGIASIYGIEQEGDERFLSTHRRQPVTPRHYWAVTHASSGSSHSGIGR